MRGAPTKGTKRTQPILADGILHFWRRHRLGGGGGVAVRESQIQLRKIAGKWRENGGAVTKSPEASRRNTSAQGTHRAPTRTRGGRAKAVAGKTAKIAK